MNSVKFQIQNQQNSVELLHASNELSEKEIKKNTIYKCSKKNKILRNKFNQGNKRSIHWQLQDFDKNKLKETQMEGYSVLVDWKINIIKMSIPPRTSYWLNADLINIAITFLQK